MKLKCTFLLSWVVIGIVSLISCQPEAQMPVTVMRPTTTATVENEVEATSTPVAMATPIPLPTLTPLPTFSPDELETAVTDLLANPMNCDVPCWWGAIPNETTVFEVQEFLALYQYENYFTRDNDNDQIADYIELESGKGFLDFNVRYGFENTILTFVITKAFPISTILEKYGLPDEIWLSTGLERYPMPFRLNLVYLQDGMAFGYTANGNVKNNLIEGCYANLTGRMSLKSSNNTNSYNDFPSIFYPEDFLYLTLEEATDLTMNDFIQQFSDPSQSQCIETPIELWEER